MGEPVIGEGGLLPAILIGLGLLTGVYGSLIGIGGALLLVPGLLLLYPEADPLTITAVSLSIILINAVAAAAAYHRQARTDYRAGFLLAGATIPGVLAGVWTLQFVSRADFTLIFSLLMIALSFLLIFKRNPAPAPAISGRQPFNIPLGLGLSGSAGYLAGLLGIGGGIIHVPAMTYILRFPAHIATATSSFILIFTAFAGVVMHMVQNNFGADWGVIPWLAVGGIAGAQIGSRLSRRLQGQTLIRILAISLAAAGIRLIFG
ncbi:protein of unknown function DUF81 [Dehalogenimonas lykanthroporepellens BL-DC-9]|jgi:uncharacterized membrane protein YfcA|nr:protein of unknown function DUF81 [Dehalogenimonas lykanthroporepellens BL-DC-9]